MPVPFSEKPCSWGLPTTPFWAGAALFVVFEGATWPSAGVPAQSEQAKATTMIRLSALMIPAIEWSTRPPRGCAHGAARHSIQALIAMDSRLTRVDQDQLGFILGLDRHPLLAGDRNSVARVRLAAIHPDPAA